jgi:membrane protease YdiL (CAAX protease family)
MKTVAEWIRRHPVATFFLFTLGVGWPVEIIYYASPGTSDAKDLILLLAVLSPAMGAMLISGIEEPRPKGESGWPRWIAFGLSWLVTAPILFLYGWKIQELDRSGALVSGGILALASAWILSSVYARTPGIRKQFSTLLRPRGPALWYLVIFLIFPGVPLLGMAITRLLGGAARFYRPGTSVGDVAVFFVLEFLHGFFLTGGVNEETGWRGFALPRLQARYPVIVSAAIVWVFWAGWHVPYDIGRGIPLGEMLLNRLFFNLLVAILMTWLYNRTNGSILAPALFHPAMNTFGNQFEVVPVTIALLTLVTVLAIVVDRMWKKLPAGNPAAFRTIGEATYRPAGAERG